ncbi:hypothetical protein ALI144C_23595 [Actinosynnema sp. ALI-1.44]|uniref:DUF3558 family protein n=1 Tax=Actinosynnema sp. ALI-1.44 TaxID=1933779 RepID=UPI00097BAD78|nr:DUF3558 family protein [Actinosynnema sp. ALI-1.44]ONI79740.1 hypothetical protein ALI144C_23595 [Actinosynnema sp. ALI-1.44]
MRRLAALALLPLTLTVACDNSTTTTPPPTTTSTTTPTTSNSARAPRVPTPLETAAYTANPCRSLTAAQQRQFGVSAGDLVDAAREGTSCFYRYPGGVPTATTVTYATRVPTGLNSKYHEHSTGMWTYWEPTVVDGYPALGFQATYVGDPTPQVCNFAIAVTDSLYFWVTADDKPGADKCSAAKDVASAVLTTVKAGA